MLISQKSHQLSAVTYRPSAISYQLSSIRWDVILMGLLFPLLSALTTARAQVPVSTHWASFSPHASFVGVNAAGTAASSDFSNQLAVDLFTKSEIDSTTLLNGVKGLNMNQNRIGADYELSLMVKLNLGQSAHSILFKMADVAHAHAGIPQSAAALTFQGNKAFAGDTVDVSDMQGSLWRYQQLGLGWEYKPEPSTSFFIMGSFINGEQFFDADIERLHIYTSSLGDTIAVSMKGRYVQSDTGRIGFAQPNGGGAAVDFGFAKTFQARSSQWRLSAAVYNLGLVQWNSAAVGFWADTSLEWTGIRINDIQNIDAQFSDDTLEDSLLLGINQGFHQGPENRMLPGWAHAELMQFNPRGTEFGGGAVLRWKSGYRPYAYLKGGYRFGERIAAHATVGYGGYGTLQVGFNAAIDMDHFSAQVSIGNLEAFALPTKFAGGSARLTLKYHFG